MSEFYQSPQCQHPPSQTCWRSIRLRLKLLQCMPLFMVKMCSLRCLGVGWKKRGKHQNMNNNNFKILKSIPWQGMFLCSVKNIPVWLLYSTNNYVKFKHSSNINLISFQIKRRSFINHLCVVGDLTKILSPDIHFLNLILFIQRKSSAYTPHCAVSWGLVGDQIP